LVFTAPTRFGEGSIAAPLIPGGSAIEQKTLGVDTLTRYANTRQGFWHKLQNITPVSTFELAQAYL
jgi:hypothetical protein